MHEVSALVKFRIDAENHGLLDEIRAFNQPREVAFVAFKTVFYKLAPVYVEFFGKKRKR